MMECINTQTIVFNGRDRELFCFTCCIAVKAMSHISLLNTKFNLICLTTKEQCFLRLRMQSQLHDASNRKPHRFALKIFYTRCRLSKESYFHFIRSRAFQ